MRYENRQAPEGINTTRVNPFAQLIKLLIAATIMLVLLVMLLQFAGAALAKTIPFKYEKQLTDKYDIELGSANASPEMVAYLNELAARVATGLELAEGVEVSVHYSDEPVFNAFATIGGNLLFYRGLLQELPNENALAMVMAHEIAHVNHRDPIASFGGGVSSMIAVSMLTGFSGMAERFMNKTYLIAGTQFTRSMESAADRAALSAVNQLYGHVNGAGALFEIMGGIKSDSKAIPDWLERFSVTHPLSDDRVSAVNELAQQNNWRQDGELTPLPPAFSQWLIGL